MCLIQHCQLLFFFPSFFFFLFCFLIHFVPTDFSVQSTRRARGLRLEFNAALLPPLYIHAAVVAAAAALLAFFWWNEPVTDSLFFFRFFLFLLYFCFYLVYRHLFHFNICAWTFGHGSLAPAAYILMIKRKSGISMISYPSVDWSRLFFILPLYFFSEGG